MKRLLALTLAVLMLAAGAVTALAEETAAERAAEVPIRVEGQAPGNPIDLYYYANYTDKHFAKHGIALDYVTDYSITSIRFQNGTFKGTLYSDDDYIGVDLVNPNYAELSPSFSHPLEDTMILTLSNGVEYSFPFLIREINKSIRILLKDENGSVYIQGDDCTISVGSSVNFTLEVLDTAKISQPPYHVKLT